MAHCPGCKPTMLIFTRLIVSTTKRRSMRPCRRSPTSYGWARRSTSASVSGRPQQIQDGHDLAEELGIHLISNQPQYSMLWRVIEGDVVPVCVSLGISQIVFSPIAQGVLTGKYRPGEQLPTGSRATDEKGGADTIKRWMRDDVLKRVQQLGPLAEEAGLSTAQLAVAWVLQNDNVASAIIGASRPEQVHDNAAAAGVVLEEDLLAKIDEVLDPVIERDPVQTLKSSPETR